MVLAILLALAAAASFALGSALQHRVAGDEPAGQESGLAFGQRLVQRPSWLIGLMLSGAAFALHALALRQGDLALVQPVIVSGIVFAVLIRSALARRLPRRRTMIWLVLTWVGLAMFLAVRPQSADGKVRPGVAVLIIVLGAVLALVAVLLAGRTEVDRRRGVLLGTAAGTLFGLVAGDVKLVFIDLRSGWGTVFGHWPLWTLVVFGAAAVVANQRAYQVARLSVTAPVLNIAQVVVGMLFGVLVFHEGTSSSAWQLVGQAIGLGLVIAGVIQLASQSGAPAKDGSDDTEAASTAGRGSTAD